MKHEVKMQLRLPVEIRDALAADARDNNRSMNGQIIAILKEHFRSIGVDTGSSSSSKSLANQTK
ncbi:MAG: Arc family DNA-binding protein [Paraburkholderia sp.]|nr:MAG: Arc family DNA-binding protein [Paraburkholderia sp.]